MNRRFLLAACLLLPTPAFSQEPQGPPPAAAQEGSTPTELQRRIEQLKGEAGLDETLRNNLLEAYGRALEAARNAEQFVAKAGEWRARREQAPTDLQLVQQKLKAPPPAAPPLAADLPDLERQLAQAQQDLRDKTAAATAIDAELAAQPERRAGITQRQLELQRRLQELPSQAAGTELDPRLLAARNVALQTERRQLESELAALESELAAIDGTLELRTARRDLLARQAAALKGIVDREQQEVQSRRTAAAQRAQAEAQREAARPQLPPELEPLATENAALAGNLPELAAAKNLAEAKKTELDTAGQRIGKDIEYIRTWDNEGASDAIGQLLRQRRAQLPEDLAVQRRQLRETQRLLTEAQRKYLQFDKRRLSAAEGSDERKLPATAQAGELLGKRSQLLAQLSNGWYGVSGDLAAVLKQRAELGRQIATLQDLVNERVLWIRSSQPVWRLDFAALAAATAWLLSPANWLQAGSCLWTAFADEPWLLLLLLLIVAPLALRPQLRRRLRLHAEGARRGQNIAYLPTALAFVDTLLLALPVPLLMWLAASRLAASADAAPFCRAVAAGASQSA